MADELCDVCLVLDTSLFMYTYVYFGGLTIPVGAFDVVSSKGVFAGCDGRIHVLDLEEAQSSASLVPTSTAVGHYGSVCAVLHLWGSTKENSVTSFFRTFVGRPVASTSQDFVLSIGVGNVTSDMNNAFPNSVLNEDFCINAWMI